MLNTIVAQVLYLLVSGILCAAGVDQLISATKGNEYEQQQQGPNEYEEELV